MNIFGVVVSFGEFVTIIGIFFAMVAGWTTINLKLNAIIERNVDADKRLEYLERQLESKLMETKSVLEARITVAEDRISKQDVVTGRNDERLKYIQEQLNRVVTLLEKRNDLK
jgi:hypothetical protein